ncbi:nuclear pore complex protein Nup205-like [Culex quinquefasciatus]|uniref:nuclear pore complex protein Nup205-like n=1 Tax=Culex quinquefasciatus TaxID=7176 RepID=UPI0018E394B8|nr:nuclear pore complex protein Nup205-like [Culex quinquefasciatus]
MGSFLLEKVYAQRSHAYCPSSFGTDGSGSQLSTRIVRSVCLLEVLLVIHVVASYGEVERVVLSKHPIWAPLHVGLISWSVPIALKAELVQTRAALGKSYRPSTAIMRQLNVNRQILRLFVQNERITNEIRQGFVDCLILIDECQGIGGQSCRSRRRS